MLTPVEKALNSAQTQSSPTAKPGRSLLERVFGLGWSEPGLETPKLAQLLVDVLSEAAAVVGEEGTIMAANLAWFDLMGQGLRLPSQAPIATDLFRAFAAARRDHTTAALVNWHDQVCMANVSLLPHSVFGQGQAYLLRLVVQPPSQAPAESPAFAAEPDMAPAVRPQAALPLQGDVLAMDALSLDTFAATAPFGAALLDGADPLDALIIQSNQAFSAITGAADQGRRFCDLIEPAARAEVAAQIAAGKTGPVEVRLVANPTGLAHLYLSRSDGRFVAYLVDVSEQKQLELQLSQSQKMQAIGQLAGGVAHDFNNLLSAIQLRLDELLHRHPVGDPSYEGLNEIRQTAVRAADLVRKLLAFSRKQTLQREVLDLGELISEFSVLLRRLLREDVKLETDYGRNLPMVRVDKSQLETAVMNLAVNARDAVRAQGGGIVKIRTARLSQDQALALGYAPENPGEGEVALIEVADNGPGIPPEVMSKIFDPFFTTKPVGEGTGLGLATVYGIIKQADGWIHVETGPGKGAAFRIFLRVHVPSVGLGLAPAPVARVRPAARDLSGAGRILFVEDEDAVRGVAARLLRARGYEVIEACDGEEALVLAEEYAGKIDLLISDVIMPGIDGPTLLKRAREFLGSAPVMFISGYAEAEFSDLLEGETGVTFLPKPLDIKILAERVKQQLQAG
jgi:two-component system cell cycle sensor histidine kinase/response regulator CckA